MSREQMIEIGLKTVTAAAFFFVLQYVILKASFDTSLFWAIALGGGAGLLAWSQQTR
ncbi:MAG: hypothetical protein ABL901_04995 [Hyphomicrobiaceae bacterium]